MNVFWEHNIKIFCIQNVKQIKDGFFGTRMTRIQRDFHGFYLVGFVFSSETKTGMPWKVRTGFFTMHTNGLKG